MAVAHGHAPDAVRASSLDALAPGAQSLRPFAPDIIVNATSASLQGESLLVDPALFVGAQLVLDMMYGAGLTPFLVAARDAGAPRLADGLGMLVEQAAEGFFLWRGKRPETAPVLERLRSRLERADQ